MTDESRRTTGEQSVPSPPGFIGESRLKLAEFFVYAMIFVSPLVVYRAELFGVSLSLQRLFLMLAAGTWLANRLAKRDLSLPRPGLALVPLGAFALLIVYELAQLPITTQPGYAYQFVAKMIAGFVLVSMMLVVLDSPRKLGRGMLAFLASSVIPLAIGLYQTLGGVFGYEPRLPFWEQLPFDDRFLLNLTFRVYGEEIPRISSTLASPPFFGQYLTFVALLLGIMLVYKKLSILHTVAAGSMLTVALFCLLYTVSRSAWLVAALGLVMVAALARRELLAFLKGRISRWVLPGVVAGVLSLVLVSGFPLGLMVDSSLDTIVPGYKPQLSSQAGTLLASTDGQNATPSAGADSSGLQRSIDKHFGLRAEAVRVFMDNPVFGVGLGNSGTSAHSYGFTFLAEGGIVGIAILLLFLGSFVLSVRRVLQIASPGREWRSYLLWLYICLVLLMINNLFLYNTMLRDTSFVLLGLGLAAIKVFSETGTGLTRD